MLSLNQRIRIYQIAQPMTFALLCIFITILWIVLGTSQAKLHPFLVLFSAALLLAILLGLPLTESLNFIQIGFGQIVQKIGLLILFGTVIGVAMEQSGATLSIAQGILKIMNRLPLPYAISSIGYLVSIPVFCDAAFVILSHLNKTLSRQTKTPLVGLTVALSTGLFAPHVLVPPTPGPLAAAANLELAGSRRGPRHENPHGSWSQRASSRRSRTGPPPS